MKRRRRPVYVATQPRRCAGQDAGPAGHCLACGAPEGDLCQAPPADRYRPTPVATPPEPATTVDGGLREALEDIRKIAREWSASAFLAGERTPGVSARDNRSALYHAMCTVSIGADYALGLLEGTIAADDDDAEAA